LQNKEYFVKDIIKSKVLAALLGAILVTSSISHAAAKSDIAKGKVIYVKNCQGCHGDKGQGGAGVKLANASAQWEFRLFKRALLEAKDEKGVALKSPMPNFSLIGIGGKLPKDADLINLQAYIKTLR
jgi:mono/diheme cytochrome c family protein